MVGDRSADRGGRRACAGCGAGSGAPGDRRRQQDVDPVPRRAGRRVATGGRHVGPSAGVNSPRMDECGGARCQRGTPEAVLDARGGGLAPRRVQPGEGGLAQRPVRVADRRRAAARATQPGTRAARAAGGRRRPARLGPAHRGCVQRHGARRAGRPVDQARRAPPADPLCPANKGDPDQAVTARAVALRSAAPALPAVRALLERFCAQPERWVYRRELNLDVPVVVGEDNETLLRGVVWAVADVDEDWVTPALAAVTVHAATAFEGSPGYPHCPRLANSAVLVLAQRPGDLPVTTLSRLSLAVRNNALRSRLATALTELGALRGWSPGEVAELAVDRHGLNADGRAVEVLGEYEAVVAVDPQTAKAALSFHRDGKAVKGVPAMVKEVHGERLGALRTTVKELNGTLALERLRLDRLMSSPRDWRYQDWVSRYLDHPVTGMFARRLLWEVDADGEWCAGLPARHEGAWVLVGRAGEGMTGERVRLWHPIRATIDEIAAWRDHVLAAALRQPFKQAFREVYLLTPAEEQTGTYSNRFAGHILRYRQANALMRTRGWTSNYLGFFSSGYQGEAVKELADGQWRAMFFHELVDNRDRDDTEVRFCSTDQVRFARRDGAVWDQARVADVPPAVFSEAMRDVDLFVGVTSIAADPQWTDRGEHRFDAYWEATAFGALTATAEIRRETLARLLPSTKIASKVELGERFLRVFGTRRTYKVHLGSGNILMEPNDAYLCVVARKRSTPTLHLPFDEDPMLSVILSKAFLLAADDKITDPSIVQQLGR